MGLFRTPPEQPAVTQEYTPTPQDEAADPAEGSQVKAWLTLGQRPTRAGFAAWSQSMTTAWTKQSFYVIGALSALSAVIIGILYLALHIKVLGPTNGSGVQSYITYTPRLFIVYLIEQTIAGVLQAVVVALCLALFMNAGFGRYLPRFFRALKPILLATVPIQAVNLITSVVGAIVVLPINKQLIALTDVTNRLAKTPTDTALQHQQTILSQQTFLPSVVSLLMSALAVAYTIFLYMQAGQVASNLNRWWVLGILVFAYLAFTFGTSLLFYPLNLLTVQP